MQLCKVQSLIFTDENHLPWLTFDWNTNITKYMLHSKVSNSGDVFVKTHLFRHVKLMFFIFSGKFGVFFKDVFCNEPLPATGLRIHKSHSRNSHDKNRHKPSEPGILRHVVPLSAGGFESLHGTVQMRILDSPYVCVREGYYKRFFPKFWNKTAENRENIGPRSSSVAKLLSSFNCHRHFS